MKRIMIINGPSLNLTGRREPDIYGHVTMEQMLSDVRTEFSARADISYLQTNHEGAIIDALQEAMEQGFDGIVMNPGAYSHTSLAIADAVRSITVPVIEVHLSNIHAREEIRCHSLTATAARGVIAGLGMRGYSLAISALLDE